MTLPFKLIASTYATTRPKLSTSITDLPELSAFIIYIPLAVGLENRYIRPDAGSCTPIAVSFSVSRRLTHV